MKITDEMVEAAVQCFVQGFGPGGGLISKVRLKEAIAAAFAAAPKEGAEAEMPAPCPICGKPVTVVPFGNAGWARYKCWEPDSYHIDAACDTVAEWNEAAERIRREQPSSKPAPPSKFIDGERLVEELEKAARRIESETDHEDSHREVLAMMNRANAIRDCASAVRAAMAERKD